MTKAQAMLIQNPDWQAAVEEASQKLAAFNTPIDLLLVFASALYGPNLPQLVAALFEKSEAKILLGCTGQGIIGQNREVEDRAALTVLALSLPGAKLKSRYVRNLDLELGNPFAGGEGANAWLLLGDPFTTDAERVLTLLSTQYPGKPLIGGMASADFSVQRRTQLFLNGQVFEEGLLALEIGGAFTLRPVVSQGATPIGESWMVTAAKGNIVELISGRPAYQVLIETFQALSTAQQHQFQQAPLVGLAVDEYKSDFKRGDFIIRSLVGIDPNNGLIAVGDEPRVGQTIQFQLRDAAAADEDLRELLGAAKQNLAEDEAMAGVLFSCNGRGLNLFEGPDHDATAIADYFGDLPLAGFFCAGEIGPIGHKNFLHGFTASLGLFVPIL